jgi:signal peptidase I
VDDGSRSDLSASDLPDEMLATRPLGELVAPGREASEKRGWKLRRRPEQPRSRARNAIEWGVLLVLALVAAIVIKTFLVQAFYIPSGSMEPTLDIGDRVLVNKLAYRLGDPHRGDIVVFERPPAESSTEIKDLIKRVIGLPGETIATDGIGHIVVDGKPLDESGYLHDTETFSNTRIPEQRIPPDRYWVMGDNRDHSKDSRVFGPIARSLLVGKAFVRVWPPSRIGGL